MLKNTSSTIKEYQKTKTFVILLIIIISALILLFYINGHYIHESRTVAPSTQKNKISTYTTASSFTSQNSDENQYQMHVGATGSADEQPPTQTAWVDPNGGGYFTGDGPFDITDKDGNHHLIDPVKSGWTKTTYDDIQKSYTDNK
ncbi:hypothetical protein [Leuconostoc litchii]|uniref:Uncharacterized protein n=2 Tax=Leuconostoc litchii TaxID=1981069 RepID=A0A6P2CJQ9_9LACO|nr:hypothetical protein [Leuconostoc litchii]TYC46080.1 hypothetical protein ESZ47_08590 [Leuconostoc litchii]